MTPLYRPIVALLVAATCPLVSAQRGTVEVVRSKHLPAPQANLTPPARPYAVGRLDVGPNAGTRPAILLTGYWPPSNEAVRRFSTDPVQNPAGWIGSNWEGRGYDVHSFFPEFTPPDCQSCGKGTGDLEVDYQDTSADFWPIADGLAPIAVITFSRGFPDKSWEVEFNQYNRDLWVDDYVQPKQPTPAPPDSGVPAGWLRNSTLPVDAIVDAVDVASLGLNAQVCYSGDGGGFLSEFIAYHGVWYQALHEDPSDPAWCVAGGHVHVGGLIDWDTARRAAEQTLRTVIGHVDSVLEPGCHEVVPYCPTTAHSAGPGALLSTVGSTSIAGNGLSLVVAEGVPSEFGLFFYGFGRDSVPFGNGTRCVLAPLYRILPPVQTDAAGFVSYPLDFTAPPLGSGPGQLLAGDVASFQFWFRDPQAGGAMFDASSAIEVRFCP